MIIHILQFFFFSAENKMLHYSRRAEDLTLEYDQFFFKNLTSNIVKEEILDIFRRRRSGFFQEDLILYIFSSK